MKLTKAGVFYYIQEYRNLEKEFFRRAELYLGDLYIMLLSEKSRFNFILKGKSTGLSYVIIFYTGKISSLFSEIIEEN